MCFVTAGELYNFLRSAAHFRFNLLRWRNLRPILAGYEHILLGDCCRCVGELALPKEFSINR